VAITFSPDGTRLLAAADRSIFLWDVATGQHVATIPLVRPGRVFASIRLGFAPNGRQLFATDGAGSIFVFDAGGGP
jgi:WD40 repeat protein